MKSSDIGLTLFLSKQNEQSEDFNVPSVWAGMEGVTTAVFHCSQGTDTAGNGHMNAG